MTWGVGHLALPEGKKSMGKILAPNNVSPRESELKYNEFNYSLGNDVNLGNIFWEKAIMCCPGEKRVESNELFPGVTI